MKPGSTEAALAFLASTRYLTDGVPTWRKGLDGRTTLQRIQRPEEKNAEPEISKPARRRTPR